MSLPSTAVWCRIKPVVLIESTRRSFEKATETFHCRLPGLDPGESSRFMGSNNNGLLHMLLPYAITFILGIYKTPLG